MTDVAPKRNLPDAAEAWGRYVDEKLTLVLQALSGANETAGNALRASGGAMNAIVAMTEVAAEQAGRIEKLRGVLEPEQIPSPPTAPALSSVLGTVSIRWDGRFVKSGGVGFKEVFAQMSVSRPATRPAGTTEAEWVDPTPWVRVGQGLAEAGAVVIPVETGVNIWARLVAVNYSGGQSLPSSFEVVRSVGLIVGTEIAPNVIVQEHIAARAITGEKVAAGALDGMVITGAVIQTDAGSKGLKVTNTGLQLYNAAGDKTVDLKAADGSALLTGTFRNRTSGSRVQISSTSDVSTINFYTPNTVIPARVVSEGNAGSSGEGIYLYAGSNTTSTGGPSSVQLYENGNDGAGGPRFAIIAGNDGGTGGAGYTTPSGIPTARIIGGSDFLSLGGPLRTSYATSTYLRHNTTHVNTGPASGQISFTIGSPRPYGTMWPIPTADATIAASLSVQDVSTSGYKVNYTVTATGLFSVKVLTLWMEN